MEHVELSSSVSGGNVKYSDPNKHTCCKITAIPIKMKMQLKYLPKELDVM